MAICTGLIVANIYYIQPLIILVAKEFHIPENVAGSAAYLTQAGYATGLLLLVPLGDMMEKRKQIMIVTSVAVLSLMGCCGCAGILDHAGGLLSTGFIFHCSATDHTAGCKSV